LFQAGSLPTFETLISCPKIPVDRFENIFQAKAGTTECDEAEVLALLIREYEDNPYCSIMQ
jgi:hypothetical protein